MKQLTWYYFRSREIAVEKFLRVGEAAQYLRAHPTTVRRWVREGRLPARQSGNHLLFTERDLNRFIRPVVPGHSKKSK